MNCSFAVLVFALGTASAPFASAQHDHSRGAGPASVTADQAGVVGDSADVVAAAERFNAALVAANRAAVEALLLDDVVILEGGTPETKAEYLGHHFGADAAFLAAMERTPGDRQVRVTAEAAWVATMSRLRGTVRERAVDLDSAELLVLRRTAEGWRIAAVHWSSSPRR